MLNRKKFVFIRVHSWFPGLGSRLSALGFTLVEVLVAVAIIALLASMMFPVIKTARNAAKTAATKTTFMVLTDTCEAYFQTYGAYPGPVANGSIATPEESSENLYAGLTSENPSGGGRWYAPPNKYIGDSNDKLIDDFGEMILYARANRGKSGVAEDDNTAQYNRTHLWTSLDLTNTRNYLEDPNFSGQPARRDSFVLISVGPDKDYGTDDDVKNW